MVRVAVPNMASKTSSARGAKSRVPEFTIRWVLTHDPIALFEEAARSFARNVAEASQGEMEVLVFTPKEYGNGRWVAPSDVVGKVVEGELEMSQTYSTVLGKLYNRLWALDLPFLFRNHEHAAAVLDGPIGSELLAGLVPSGLRGLSFTYSGGYRIISTTEKAVRCIEDLEGLRVRTSSNPVVTNLFESVGAQPYPAALQDIPSLTQQGLIDAAESTWPRYWDMGHYQHQPIAIETSHSLFLTSLVINESFYQSLPRACQQVLNDAAIRVAQEERTRSVEDGIKARNAWQRQGGTVLTWSSDERERFADAAANVYDRFVPQFGTDLIQGIRCTP